MNNYGPVIIRLKNRVFTQGTLLDFTTIPVPVSTETGESHKVLVYAIVETENGNFLARQLSEIKRPAKTETKRLEYDE